MRWIITTIVVIVALILGISSGLFSTNANVLSLGALIICVGLPLIVVFRTCLKNHLLS